MSRARFVVHGALVNFLAPENRTRAVDQACARAATLKQAIESLGVPHTEIGRVMVNRGPATLARIVHENDLVEVFPHDPGAAPFEHPLAFIADAHLGGLARMLRMLGFDATYDNAAQDEQIAEQSALERRVVLTRDRELLKRREVLRGCYVTTLKPEAQLREISLRYDLPKHMRPFTLCLHCNLPLRTAEPAAVRERVPDRIREHYKSFMHCAGCDRVYWEGSHWDRMRAVLAGTLELPFEDMR
jgi:uncharacterized protein with PIN domain